MRSSIPHLRLRRRPWRSAAQRPAPRRAASSAARALSDPGAGSEAAAGVPASAASVPDPAVMRVRRAGGPVDHASYTCACGYVFTAPVSTTVCCPHCAAGQPW
jgi:hypothetical protein